MRSRLRNLTVAAAVALTATLTAATGADAQRRGRRPPPQLPWASISAGVHFGYDDSSNGEVLGSHLRIPLLRDGRVELMPSANATFLTGLREYQYTVEAVYVTGGRRGGIYAGGGIGWRNSVFSSTPTAGRETIRGTSLVAGVKSPSAGSSFGFQLELRWIFLDGVDFDPRVLTLGINFPLTNRGRAPGAVPPR